MAIPPVIENNLKPRITFVIISLFKGGAETQMVRLAVALADRGWTVRIVTLMDLNDYGGVLSEKNILVDSLGIPRGRYDPRSLPKLVRLFRRHRPDIVCTFLYHSNVLGRVAARLAGVPVVVSSIRNAVFGGWLADKLMSMTDKLATRTTTNSELAAKALLERRVVRPERLQVIRNAVELSAPGSEVKSRDQLVGRALGSTWLWLSVGRLEPQKANEVAMKALARLRKEGKDVHLAIAGSGSQEGELLALRSALDLDDSVSFLGNRKDIGELMAASDGLVLASRWEGLPNVVLEACLAGLPVVATSVGGVTEIIENDRTGVVVVPDDEEALADGMRRLMQLSPEQRAEMTRTAREYVESAFEPQAVMDVWEGLFEELLDGRRRR
jgi:glycosyltransferase involved in cell wall biosynthesis